MTPTPEQISEAVELAKKFGMAYYPLIGEPLEIKGFKFSKEKIAALIAHVRQENTELRELANDTSREQEEQWRKEFEELEDVELGGDNPSIQYTFKDGVYYTACRFGDNPEVHISPDEELNASYQFFLRVRRIGKAERDKLRQENTELRELANDRARTIALKDAEIDSLRRRIADLRSESC